MKVSRDCLLHWDNCKVSLSLVSTSSILPRLQEQALQECSRVSRRIGSWVNCTLTLVDAKEFHISILNPLLLISPPWSSWPISMSITLKSLSEVEMKRSLQKVWLNWGDSTTWGTSQWTSRLPKTWLELLEKCWQRGPQVSGRRLNKPHKSYFPEVGPLEALFNKRRWSG